MSDEVTEDPRHVVVTKENDSADDYIAATVYPDKDSAEEFLTGRKAAAPWHSHSVVSYTEFTKGPEGPTDPKESE